MANMTADISRPYKGDALPIQYGMVGYTDRGAGSSAYTAYKGAIMIMDVDDIDGYVQPHQSGITSASGDVFAGVAMEKKSVTSSDTAQDDVKIAVATGGVWAFAVASITVTDIGAPAYASDDQVVTTTSTDNQWIGTIVDVDGTYVWVNIGHAAGRANSAT